MVENITTFFSNIFGNNVILATILISIVPIIELRGAIPFAVNKLFWPTNALNIWQSLLYSLIGSSLVVPILALIFIPLLKWLKNTKLFKKLACAMENYIKSKSKQENFVSDKNSSNLWKKILFVFVFVAIPLPLTGVWTGTCIACVLNLNFLTTCLTVVCANVIAGLIIVLILTLFPWLNNWLFLIFLVIVCIALLIELIKSIIKKTNKPNE